MKVYSDLTKVIKSLVKMEDKASLAAKISVIIAQDASASMGWEGGTKIREAKRATIAFSKHLDQSQSELALISFQRTVFSKVKILCPFTHNSNEIIKKVRNLKPRGKTPFLYAMQVAGEKVLPQAKGERVLMMVTDGLPSYSSTNKIINYGMRLKRSGARIITVAIGDDADRDLLRSLASGEADYHVAEVLDQLTEKYLHIATGLVKKD